MHNAGIMCGHNTNTKCKQNAGDLQNELSVWLRLFGENILIIVIIIMTLSQSYFCSVESVKIKSNSQAECQPSRFPFLFLIFSRLFM